MAGMIERYRQDASGNKDIKARIEEADIILLMMSSDFLAPDFCYHVELQTALRRHESGEVWVIPVILRPCHWQLPDLRKLLALPKDGKAITSWENRDEAWVEVVTGIMKICDYICRRENEISKLVWLKKEEKKLFSEKDTIFKKVKKNEQGISTLGEELYIESEFKDAIMWLNDNQKLMSERAGKKFFSKGTDKDLDQFRFEIEKYLELIKGCLLTGRSNLIDEPIIQPTFGVPYYTDAFEFIESRIPEHLSDESIHELRKYLKYLVSRIQ